MSHHVRSKPAHMSHALVSSSLTCQEVVRRFHGCNMCQTSHYVRPNTRTILCDLSQYAFVRHHKQNLQSLRQIGCQRKQTCRHCGDPGPRLFVSNFGVVGRGVASPVLKIARLSLPLQIARHHREHAQGLDSLRWPAPWPRHAALHQLAASGA
jgi:hypothetical protein